jgi:DMSO/TMAO reductase YedYZ molybdopterin-dependent catalytic subunit
LRCQLLPLVTQHLLAIDYDRYGEVMIACQMNDGQLPMLNGFPLRLVVPGSYSTY